MHSDGGNLYPSATTVEQCRLACIAASPTCYGFDVTTKSNTNAKECWLNSGKDASAKLKPMDSATHYKRNCNDDNTGRTRTSGKVLRAIL